MATKVHVLDLIDKPLSAEQRKIFAMIGSDSFLRQQAIQAAIESIKVDRASIRQFHGDETPWREVHDYLATRSLFDEDGYRVALVSNGDAFVTECRPQLESWVDSKSKDATLILDVKKMPSNTKLYKAIQKVGTIIDCSIDVQSNGKSSEDKLILKWIVSWAKRQHAIDINNNQANLILERVGYIFGIIDCELAKLALFADATSKVPDDRVRELVGGWRTKTIWDIAELIADGKAAAALEQLDGLVRSGEHMLAVVGPISWYFRRFGMASYLVEQSEKEGKRVPLKTVLMQAGFKYKVEEAEKHLIRIGRHRAKNILHWLKDLDGKLKGSHSIDERGRFAVEEFILRLA